jgi:hypothetical protein
MTDQDPRRLTVVLNDPSAEWAEIRSAMRAKAQRRGGACTNLVVMNALSSASGRSDDDNYRSPIMRAAAEQPMKTKVSVSDRSKKQADVSSARSLGGSGDDAIMPPGDKIRRESLTSQDSCRSNSSQSRRPSLRNGRSQSSRRRTFRRNSQRGSSRHRPNGSIRSIESINSSSSSLNINNSSFKLASISAATRRCSIDIMDFGVSERALMAAQDDCGRSCVSLDEDVLEELQEEFDNNYDDGNEGKGGGAAGGGLLLNWRHNDSSLRFIDNSGLDDGSTRSEGDLDSFVDSCGFLDWPSVAEEVDGNIIETGDGASGTIQELVQLVSRLSTKLGKSADNAKREEEEWEEWNIEDYENNLDDSAHSRLRQSVARTFQKFARVPRRDSNALSKSSHSQEGPTDLFQIKQTLLNAKNKQHQQGMEEEVNNNKKKRGSMPPRSRILLFDRASPTDRRSSASATDDTTRGAIWVRDSRRDLDIDEDDEYKKMYDPAPSNATQRIGGWNIFDGVKSNKAQNASQRRRSNNLFKRQVDTDEMNGVDER